jgi:membrane protein implicated in regulation of membrane protease activity
MSHEVMGIKRSLWIVVTLAITAMNFAASGARILSHGTSALAVDLILANMTAQGAAESNDENIY